MVIGLLMFQVTGATEFGVLPAVLSDLIQLLTTETTASGVLLAVVVASWWAIATDRIVPGVRYKERVADVAALKEAIEKAKPELEECRKQNTINLVRLERLIVERELSPGWPPPGPTRKQKDDG